MAQSCRAKQKAIITGVTNCRIFQPCLKICQGQRIDENHWKVQADLTIKYSSWMKEVKVEAVFKK